LSTFAKERRFHASVNDWSKTGLDGSATVNPDEWHHLTAIYDGSIMRLYIDGKLDATKPWKGGIASNDFDVLIGENAEQQGRCFDGLIDDVRVYNYALPERQIQALATGQ
jgi:hypothetical protein